MGVDKVHLKADCIDGSKVNGCRLTILYSFGLSGAHGQKIYKELEIELFKKINKALLPHIIVYLEDKNYKPTDFNNEILSFTFQLIKI